MTWGIPRNADDDAQKVVATSLRRLNDYETRSHYSCTSDAFRATALIETAFPQSLYLFPCSRLHFSRNTRTDSVPSSTVM